MGGSSGDIATTFVWIDEKRRFLPVLGPGRLLEVGQTRDQCRTKLVFRSGRLTGDERS
jgi:hypothetical protein